MSKETSEETTPITVSFGAETRLTHEQLLTIVERAAALQPLTVDLLHWARSVNTNAITKTMRAQLLVLEQRFRESVRPETKRDRVAKSK